MESANDILAPIANLLANLLSSIICVLPTAKNCIPQSAQQMSFYQWTQQGRVELDSSLATIHPMAPTYFILHGWKSDSTVVPFENIAMNFYQMNPNANVILVDYKILADRPYTLAPKIARLAGTMLGLVIIRMVEENLIRIQDIQFWGHSLGAHVSGVAAKIIKNRTGVKVPRISVADPAGPLFRDRFDSILPETLQKEDAEFVDVTHTSYGAGTIEAYGTVDTYVGLGGAFQPACLNIGIIAMLICDHSMSKHYFAESILSCGFQAQKIDWESQSVTESDERITWGQHIPLNATGIYILSVNAVPPYAKSRNTYPSCVSRIG